MIDPHVVHGGASSWFCIAANGLACGTITPVALTFAVGAFATFGAGTADSTSAASSRIRP